MSRIQIRFILIFIFTGCLFVSPVLAETDSGDDTSAENPKPDKRLFGVVPNYRTVDAGIAFAPVSRRQKLSIASHDSFDWPTYLIAAGLMFVTPGRKDAAYDGGVDGFAKRYFRSSADQIIGNMMTEGFLPILLREDPRYFRAGTGTVGSRLIGALTQIVVARKDNGHLTFNTSEFLGNAIAAGIANSYSTNLNSWSHRNEKWMLMVGTDAFSNIVKEFGPDIRQHFLRHRHKTS